MAYDPTIPALNNYIGDDIPKIMANFAALASSRIVEMGTNSNGTYVRWESGLQVCWSPEVVLTFTASTALIYNWTFPAAFRDTNFAVVWTEGENRAPDGKRAYHHRVLMHSTSGCRLEASANTGLFASEDTASAMPFAIGRWK